MRHSCDWADAGVNHSTIKKFSIVGFCYFCFLIAGIGPYSARAKWEDLQEYMQIMVGILSDKLSGES